MFTNQQGKVLDVQNSKDEEGTYVFGLAKTGKTNQRWNIKYIDEMGNRTTKGFNKERGLYINRPFYIESKLWLQRVISVAGGKNLVIQSRTDKKHQQWYFDQKTKTIKSVEFKDRSIDARSGSIYAQPTDARWY